MKNKCAKIFTQALIIAIKSNVENGRKHLKELPDPEYYEHLKLYEQITKNI